MLEKSKKRRKPAKKRLKSDLVFSDTDSDESMEDVVNTSPLPEPEVVGKPDGESNKIILKTIKDEDGEEL